MCWHAAVLGLAAGEGGGGRSQILQQGCKIREVLSRLRSGALTREDHTKVRR